MAEIKEDYVSFEVAKLLKEKGFAEKCIAFYSIDGKFFGESVYRNNWKQEIHGSINAPTLQMALKWLREVHSIYITSEPDINDKHCFYPVIYTMTEESWVMQCLEELEKLSFDKPEQAVETTLKYTLKNLI